MKKLLFIAIGAIFSSGLSAQDLASKNPENKNVVLEEFTGKTCGYCPDGHKRADEFSAANDGRVVLINIHAGNYASGTPNYNTYTDAPTNTVNYGDVVYKHPDVKLTGFPSGTVNRTKFGTNTGTAANRGQWAGFGADVMTEASPVNVGIKGVYDPAKFKLYVLVEAYYTADELNATNMINVGITQSGIYGPQSGATSFYPEKINASGEYRHDHMLRAVLTGQWGETISETTNSSLFRKMYTYDVPEKLNDIAVVPADLTVYAFVAKDEQTILSGNSVAVVEGTDPSIVDVSAISVLNSSVSAVNIYPNPTTGNPTLRINSENSFEATIKVVSVTGAVVSNSSASVAAGSNEIAIEMNSLEEGMYFVEVSSQVGMVVRQSIVKK
ncbi:MAG: hypothetical protein ACJASM_000795 [Salibacteraceae bacterium]|jgi:hypothetical protein